MKLFSRNSEDSKKENFLGGIINGVGITVFGGPIFIIGVVHGWYILILFLLLCFGSYFLIKYFIDKSGVLIEPGGGVLWWLGGVIGFCIVMLIFFTLFSLPTNA